MNNQRRKQCKEKLLNGSYTPVQFLERISSFLGIVTSFEETTFSDDSDVYEEPEYPDNRGPNQCVVCLQPRSSTWLFMPCKHAYCCTQCSDEIELLQQTCPTCRSTIEGKFQIFLN